MRQSQPSSTGKQLRCLYLLASGCSIMMVFWILLLPASWLVGRSSLHDWWLSTLPDDFPMSPQVLRKLEGHTAVHVTHILPGALWAGAIPFQLHPRVRKEYKWLHRLTGYVFLSTSVLLMIGVFIIYSRKLMFTDDFADLPPMKDAMLPWFLCISTWFTITGILALYHARCRRFALHERWVVRHIAAGLWIALQRIFGLTGSVFIAIPASRFSQRALFATAAKSAIVVSILLGEYGLHLLDGAKVELKRKVK